MPSHHLVLVALRLANPLWLDVAKLLCHFLKLEFADRGWEVVQLLVVAKVAVVVERAVPQTRLSLACQDKDLDKYLISIWISI